MAQPLAAAVAVPTAFAGHIRPLSIGDVLDLALRLYRRHFGTFFALMLGFQLPIYAVQKVYERVYAAHVPTTPQEWMAVQPEQVLSTVLVLLVAVPLVLLAAQLIGAVASGALYHAGHEAYLGRGPSVGGALRVLGRRLGPLVGTYLLLVVLLAGGTLLSALPFGGLALLAARAGPGPAVLMILLAGAASVVTAIALYLRWLLVLQVVVLEGLAGPRALRRSAELMRGRAAPGFFGGTKVRGGLVLLVLFVVLLIPGALMVIPQLMLASAYSATPGVLDPTQIPVLVRLPFEVLELGLAALLTPFSVLSMLLFYLDVRIRREGLDLELRAAALGADGRP